MPPPLRLRYVARVHEPSSASATHPSPPAGSTDTGTPHWKRNTAWFLTGQLLSLFGSSLVQFAIMWHLTLETKSANVVTLYALFAFLPQAVISLFGGTLADRINRKLLIIVPDAAIALSTLVLALLMARGSYSLWIIFLVVLIRSVGAGFQQPAVSALIPSMVPEEHLLRVNGINTTCQSLIGIASPVAGGIIYGLGGVQPTLFVDVVTAAVGIGILLLLRVRATPPHREQSAFLAELVDGLRYTASHRFFLWLIGLQAVVILLIVGPNFLVPLLVTQKFGEGVWALTGIEISFQVGMICGGVAVSTVLAKKADMRMLMVSSASFGVFALGITASPNVWVIFLMNFLCGLFVPLFATPAMTEVQKRVNEEYMGRLMSQFTLSFTLGMPLGVAVFGPLSTVVGVGGVITVTGVATIVFVLWAFLVSPTGRAELQRDREEAAAALASQETP